MSETLAKQLLLILNLIVLFHKQLQGPMNRKEPSPGGPADREKYSATATKEKVRYV